MNPRTKNLVLGFIVALVVVGSGAFEDWVGRTDYAQDALSYFDVYHAIYRGDWNLALNPLWSIGYPLMLAATVWMFPSSPEGEWTAIHVLNLIIYVASYLSFLHLLKTASIYAVKVNRAEPAPLANGFVFGIGTTLFVFWQMLTGNVSRVSPDPTICCVFFLVLATCLHFFMRPAVKTAAALGLLMGFGYVIKLAFLPASAFTLLVVGLHAWIYSPTKRLAVFSKLACALPAMALLALPYAAALSHALGTLSFGGSANINYDWHVNDLPYYCHWQGGPAPYGMPIHPTHLVLKNPPVFTFGEPFPVTYPPWYNPPYWFEGHRHFFSLQKQLSAVHRNLSEFRGIFTGEGFLKAKVLIAVLVLAGGLFLLKERHIWWRRLIALWPLHLLAMGPIGIYLLIHIEPRYVVGPIVVMLTTPFLILFVPTPLVSKQAGMALLILIVAGCGAILVDDKMAILRRTFHGVSNIEDRTWQCGLYLIQSGFHPGDKVAAVGAGPGRDVTWAYIGGFHIVAEIGNDAYDPDDQKKDLQLFLDNPEVQQTVFDKFKEAGAVVVVARWLDASPKGPGWVQVPNTSPPWEPPKPNSQWWIHRLDESTP